MLRENLTEIVSGIPSIYDKMALFTRRLQGKVNVLHAVLNQCRVKGTAGDFWLCLSVVRIRIFDKGEGVCGVTLLNNISLLKEIVFSRLAVPKLMDLRDG